MTPDPQQAPLLAALLEQVPFEGWTVKSLRQALAAIGEPPEDAVLLFPGGAPEMIAACCAQADARMLAQAGQMRQEVARVSARIRRLIALRLEQDRGAKEAIRRALAVLSLPANTGKALRITAATVDAIWHGAGDTAADFSWYSKRAVLAAVWTATVLYWLRDSSEDDAATLAFLDRRLAGIARIGRLRQGLTARLRAPLQRAGARSGAPEPHG